HRAVDAEAGLPTGSTSNLFRSRARLVGGVLERLLERETTAWSDADAHADADVAASAEGGSVDAVAALLAERVRLLAGDLRTLTVTRFALYHEAALDPELARLVGRSRAEVERRVGQWLAELGVPLAPGAVSALLSTVNGLLVEQVSSESTDGADPRTTIRLVLAGLSPPGDHVVHRQPPAQASP
ncbi:MAG: TetR/AcrR family transcriptional regulator, partial [Phycicoccus sp.]